MIWMVWITGCLLLGMLFGWMDYRQHAPTWFTVVTSALAGFFWTGYLIQFWGFLS